MRGLVTCKDLRVRLFSLNCYLFGAFQAVLTASWPPLDPRINNKSGRPHQRKFPSARPIFRLCWAPPTCSYGPADWRFSDHAAGLDQSAGQSVLHIVSTKQRSGLGANRPVHDAVGQAARKSKGNRPNSESGKLTCDLLNAHVELATRLLGQADSRGQALARRSAERAGLLAPPEQARVSQLGAVKL